MAKRMGFSVVGLPHYTVWHLYEPSVDDIRHMQEMEQERKNRENEERERADRMKKIKEEFNDPGSQWEKDKNEIEGITVKDKETKKGIDEGDIHPKPRVHQQASEETQEVGDGKKLEAKESTGARSDEGAKNAKKPEALVEDEVIEIRKKRPSTGSAKNEVIRDGENSENPSVFKSGSITDATDTQETAGRTKKASDVEKPANGNQKSRPKKAPVNAAIDTSEDKEERPRNAKSEKVVKADKGA